MYTNNNYYSQQQVMSQQARQKTPKLTHDACVMYFKQQFEQPNGRPLNVVHLHDENQEVVQVYIHACRIGGFMRLPWNQVVLYDRRVCFWYCGYCNTLWYYVPKVL